jgi:uncharacterized protein (TIGR02246 family)
MKHALCLFALSAGLANTSFANGNPNDEKALHQVVGTMEQGWNTRSGELFSSSFADTHDYIVWNGLFFPQQSPTDNARAHQGIFNSIYKNTDVKLKVDRIKFVREDLALLHVLGATYDHGMAIPEHPKVIISMLVEKKNNTWKIISFHNSDIELSFEPGAQNGTSMPLNVMYAGWYK